MHEEAPRAWTRSGLELTAGLELTLHPRAKLRSGSVGRAGLQRLTEEATLAPRTRRIRFQNSSGLLGDAIRILSAAPSDEQEGDRSDQRQDARGSDNREDGR